MEVTSSKTVDVVKSGNGKVTTVSYTPRVVQTESAKEVVRDSNVKKVYSSDIAQRIEDLSLLAIQVGEAEASILNLQQLQASLDTALATTTSTLTARVGENESNISTVQTALTTATESVATVEETLRAEFTAADNDLSTSIATAKIEAISEALADANGSMATLRSELEAAYQADDSALDGKITEAKANITELQSAVANANEAVATLGTVLRTEFANADALVDVKVTANGNRLDVAESSITSLQTSASTATQALAQLETTLTASLATEVNALDGRIDTANADISSVSSALVEEINNRLTSVATLRDTLSADMTTYTNDEIEKLETSVAGNLTAAITQLTTNYENYADDIESDLINVNIADAIAKAEDELETARSNLQGMLDQLNLDLTATNANITNLQTTLSDGNQAIATAVDTMNTYLINQEIVSAADVTRVTKAVSDTEKSLIEVINQIKTTFDTDISEARALIYERELVLTSATEAVASRTSTLESQYTTVSDKIEAIENQIDGVVETYTSTAVPVDATTKAPLAAVYPYSDWITLDTTNGNTLARKAHTGDSYVVYTDDGLGNRTYVSSYKFVKLDDGTGADTDADGYAWVQITDTDVVEALNTALEAKDLADSKRRTFIDIGSGTPPVPYDRGDLWLRNDEANSGQIWRCNVAKSAVEIAVESDWVKADSYTDDSAVIQLRTEIANGTITLDISQVLIDDNQSIQEYVAEQLAGEVKVYSGGSNDAPATANVGDMYIETNVVTSLDGKTYTETVIYKWSGTQWVPLTDADSTLAALADKVDGKRTIYSGTALPADNPTNPLQENDLFMPTSTFEENGTTYLVNELYRYDVIGETATWVGITNYDALKDGLQSQIDGKVEMHYGDIPFTDSTSVEQNPRGGDYWYCSTDSEDGANPYYSAGIVYKYVESGSEGAYVYTWTETSDVSKTVFEVANSANSLASSKKAVYNNEGGVVPTTAQYENMQVNDLWIPNVDSTVVDAEGDPVYRSGSIYTCTDVSVPTWALAATDDKVVNAIVDGDTALDSSILKVKVGETTTNLSEFVASEIDKKTSIYSGDFNPNDTAGNDTNTIYEPSQVGENDIYLWLNATVTSSSGNSTVATRTYRYNGTNWDETSSNEELTKLADIADGKRTVYASDTEPASGDIGDIWIPPADIVGTGTAELPEFTKGEIYQYIKISDDGVEPEVYEWVAATKFSEDLAAYAGAVDLQMDSKVTVYKTDDDPNSGGIFTDTNQGDIWITSTGETKYYDHSTTSWLEYDKEAKENVNKLAIKVGNKASIYYVNTIAERDALTSVIPNEETGEEPAKANDLCFVANDKLYQLIDGVWEDVTAKNVTDSISEFTEFQTATNNAYEAQLVANELGITNYINDDLISATEISKNTRQISNTNKALVETEDRLKAEIETVDAKVSANYSELITLSSNTDKAFAAIDTNLSANYVTNSALNDKGYQVAADLGSSIDTYMNTYASDNSTFASLADRIASSIVTGDNPIKTSVENGAETAATVGGWASTAYTLIADDTTGEVSGFRLIDGSTTGSAFNILADKISMKGSSGAIPTLTVNTETNEVEFNGRVSFYGLKDIPTISGSIVFKKDWYSAVDEEVSNAPTGWEYDTENTTSITVTSEGLKVGDGSTTSAIDTVVLVTNGLIPVSASRRYQIKARAKSTTGASIAIGCLEVKKDGSYVTAIDGILSSSTKATKVLSSVFSVVTTGVLSVPGADGLIAGSDGSLSSDTVYLKPFMIVNGSYTYNEYTSEQTVIDYIEVEETEPDYEIVASDLISDNAPGATIDGTSNPNGSVIANKGTLYRQSIDDDGVTRYKHWLNTDAGSEWQEVGGTYIDGSNIATGTISAAKIGAEEITADKIDITNLVASSAFISELNTNYIYTGEIEAGQIKVVSGGSNVFTVANGEATFNGKVSFNSIEGLPNIKSTITIKNDYTNYTTANSSYMYIHGKLNGVSADVGPGVYRNDKLVYLSPGKCYKSVIGVYYIAHAISGVPFNINVGYTSSSYALVKKEDGVYYYHLPGGWQEFDPTTTLVELVGEVNLGATDVISPYQVVRSIVSIEDVNVATKTDITAEISSTGPEATISKIPSDANGGEPSISDVKNVGTIWRLTTNVGGINRYRHWISEGSGVWNEVGGTYIDGGNIVTGSIDAARVDVDELMAKDIEFNGTITGGTVEGGGIIQSYDGNMVIDLVNGSIYIK